MAKLASTIVYGDLTVSRTISGDGSGLTNVNATLNPKVVSSAYTAVSGDFLLVNTSSAPITITMPAGVNGMTIRFTDFAGTWGTNNVTLSGGSYVNAAGTTQAGPFILDISSFDVTAIYHTGAWRIR